MTTEKGKCTCVQTSKFDVPLFSKPGYLSLKAPGVVAGFQECEKARNKLEIKKRINKRKIGSNYIPQSVLEMMRNTIGIEEVEGNGMVEDVIYEDAEKLADELIKTPSIWKETEQALDEDEEVMDNFFTKRRTTKSLIKMLKNAIPRLQVALAIDFYEYQKWQKMFFSERLEKMKQELLKYSSQGDNTCTQDREPEYHENEIFFEENKQFLNEAKVKLPHEVLRVKELKENYLTNVYEFQLQWLLENVSDRYQESIRNYLSTWNAMLQNLKEKVDQKLKKIENHSKEPDFEILQKMEQGIRKKWKNKIRKAKKTKRQAMELLLLEINMYDSDIESEESKKKIVLETAERISSTVENIIDQFEKLVVFGFQGKHGYCNYFLSYQKLIEFNDYLCQIASKDKNIAQKAENHFESDEILTENEQPVLLEDVSLEDAEQLKDCVNRVKGSTSSNDLKLPRFSENIPCLTLADRFENEDGQSLGEKKKNNNMEYSRHISEKLYYANRLLENKSPTQRKLLNQCLKGFLKNCKMY